MRPTPLLARVHAAFLPPRHAIRDADICHAMRQRCALCRDARRHVALYAAARAMRALLRRAARKMPPRRADMRGAHDMFARRQREQALICFLMLSG